MSRIIPKPMLEEIRHRNDIVDLIGSYMQLKRAGSAFKACCPFHKEKTPSFSVNQTRQIFHCFGCGAGGDVFGFLMQREGVDFVTAAKMLAERAGMTIELEDGDGQGSEKKKLYEIHTQVAALYHQALLERKSAAVARDYLQGRGLTPETLAAFGVGYAPDLWDAVLVWSGKQKYSQELMLQAGLIVKSAKPDARSPFYDRFRNRIMFPIYDEQGRVIAFSGRALEKSPKAAKYVNSPETPLFHKGRVLYALDKARRHIVQSREAILCEGQIDVIRCHQEGFHGAVAAQGTACSEDHVRVLKRYADSVAVVFDPDTAGQDAAIRTAVTCMSAGLAVRVVALPQGEDPDSFIRAHGATKFQEQLDRALSVVAFQIDVLSQREDIKTEIGVMRAAKAVLETVSQSPNAVQRARLIQEAARRLNVPATALQDDLRHLQGKARFLAPSQQAAAGSTGQPGKPVARPREEVELCEHMVHVTDVPALADLVTTYLPLARITDACCREVVDAALAAFHAGRDVQEVLREREVAGGELSQLTAALLMAPTKIRSTERSHEDAVKDLILFIWRRDLQHERSALGPQQSERRREITYDLKLLRTWEEGVAVIEMETTG